MAITASFLIFAQGAAAKPDAKPAIGPTKPLVTTPNTISEPPSTTQTPVTAAEASSAPDSQEDTKTESNQDATSEQESPASQEPTSDAAAASEPLQATANQLESKTEEVKEKIEVKEKAREEIINEKSKAQADLQAALTMSTRIVAENRLALESYRESIATASVNWLSKLSLILDQFKAIEAEIAIVEKALLKDNLNRDQLEDLLAKCLNQWRALIDNAFIVYDMVTSTAAIGQVPDKPSAALEQLAKAEQEAYELSYQKAVLELQGFTELKNAKVEERFEEFYHLLLRSSRARSSLLNRIDILGINVTAIDEDYIDDLWREVFAIPIRFLGFVYQKYAYIKTSATSGITGYIKILQTLIPFMVLLFVPFLIRASSKRLLKWLDEIRSKILTSGRGTYRHRLQRALAVQKLTPYSPWLLYGLGLYIIAINLKASFLEEIGFIIPILGYTIAYKIFQLTVQDAFGTLRHFSNFTALDTKNLVLRTSRIVGLFFLFSYTFLHLTKVTVEEGLLYRHVSAMMQVLGILVCAIAAYGWRQVLSPAAKQLLPNGPGNFFAQRCQGKSALFFALPTLVVLLISSIYHQIWAWLSGLEFTKKFLARIYRKKVETIVGQQSDVGMGSPPEAYRSFFNGAPPLADKTLVAANQRALDKASNEIALWLNSDDEDQSLAIYGEAGVGKSTLLDQIQAAHPDLEIFRLKIPDKICNREALNAYLATALNFAKSESLKKSIHDFNNGLSQKTLILVDDAHNLFLGRFGGFDAIREYVQLINLKTDNIFWVSVFNEYAWAYLKGILGQGQYLRSEIHLRNWSDKHIKELILSRHQQSEFSLSYDRIILASQTAEQRHEAILEAEEQFFRLLWEQSNGNPTIAMNLWISCLSLWGLNNLLVRLPERTRFTKFGALNEDTLFVLAAICRHENLTRNETVSTTNLDWGQVAHAIKVGLEQKLLARDSASRYRINAATQIDIIKQLKAKNFIYGLN